MKKLFSRTLVFFFVSFCLSCGLLSLPLVGRDCCQAFRKFEPLLAPLPQSKAPKEESERIRSANAFEVLNPLSSAVSVFIRRKSLLPITLSSTLAPPFAPLSLEWFVYFYCASGAACNERNSTLRVGRVAPIYSDTPSTGWYKVNKKKEPVDTEKSLADLASSVSTGSKNLMPTVSAKELMKVISLIGFYVN